MKITIVSGIQIFPPESGGQRRTSGLALYLAQRGHKVMIYSFTGRKKDYVERKSSATHEIQEGLKEFVNLSFLFGAMQHLSYKLKLPPLWLTLFSFIYRPRKLKKLLETSDLIIVDFPFLFPVIAGLKAKTILNTHNVENRLYPKDGIIQKIVEKIETKAVANFDQVLFCSSTDMAFFKVKPGFFLVPNGIDPSRFSSDGLSKELLRAKLKIPTGKIVILFSGSNYGPNLEAFDFLLTFAENNKSFLEENNLLFLIVGTVTDKKIAHNHILTTGKVENVDPYLIASDLAINPVISGSGTNIKMMEYLAANLCILSTPFGARGLDLEDGKDAIFFTHGNLREILEEIITNLKKEDLFKMASRAYKKNEQYFNFNNAFSNKELIWNL